MSGIAVVAEHRSGALREITLELVAAARELKDAIGGAVTLVVPGADPHLLVEGAPLAGVDEIVALRVGQDAFSSDLWREALAALLAERRPDVTLAGFTVDGMGWAPAVAARLGLGFASDVVAWAQEDGELVARRDFYGGKVQGVLDFPAGVPVLLMLRPTVWKPREATGSPPVSGVEAAVPPGADRTRQLELRAPPVADVDIGAADFILAIGRGIGERENIARFEELAGRLGATLASSRPLVDAGWMEATRQVGQSGTTVRPKLYLALGISGAIQHVAGMSGSGTIVAVNSDSDAPIFDVAHYGAVADLFDIADELEKLL